jgi:hypothetical protein
LRIDKETPRIILIFIGKKDIKDKKGKLPWGMEEIINKNELRKSSEKWIMMEIRSTTFDICIEEHK